MHDQESEKIEHRRLNRFFCLHNSMKKFLNDPQIPVLLIQRTSAKDVNKVVGTEGDEKETFLYSVTSEVLYSNAQAIRCFHA